MINFADWNDLWRIYGAKWTIHHNPAEIFEIQILMCNFSIIVNKNMFLSILEICWTDY